MKKKATASRYVAIYRSSNLRSPARSGDEPNAVTALNERFVAPEVVAEVSQIHDERRSETRGL
jgi:hypothetical protein